jgi:hypothetical protein
MRFKKPLELLNGEIESSPLLRGPSIRKQKEVNN